MSLLLNFIPSNYTLGIILCCYFYYYYYYYNYYYYNYYYYYCDVIIFYLFCRFAYLMIFEVKLTYYRMKFETDAIYCEDNRLEFRL